MPLGGIQVNFFLWQGYAQPIAEQVVSEMQMFQVRIYLQRGELGCGVLRGEDSLSP